jgi:hypothetical protein
MSVIAVVVLAGFAASLTDWLCMDALIHDAYAMTPDTWRPREGAGRIVVSQIIGTMATAASVLLYVDMPGHGLALAAELAGCVWLAGALPVLLQNAQWIRMSFVVVAGHAAAWLARLIIATGLAWLLLAR